MSAIREAETIGDLLHAGMTVKPHSFGFQHHPLPDMMPRRIPRIPFDDLVQIIGCYRQLAGIIGYHFGLFEMLVYKAYKILYKLLVTGMRSDADAIPEMPA